MNILKKVKAAAKKDAKVAIALTVAMVFGIIGALPAVKAFAGMGDYWDVKIGGEHFAYVSSESDVAMLTGELTKDYVSGPYGIKEVSLEPEVTAERGTYNKNKEEIEVVGNPTTLIPELKEKVAVKVTGEEIATKEVHFGTVYEEDPDMYEDEQYVRVEGINGSKTVVDEVTYVNGEESKRVEISVIDEVPCVNAVIVKGTKPAPYCIYPVNGTLTSGFGYRSAATTYGVGSTNHAGIDLVVPTGTPVKAAHDGVVTKSTGWMGGYGNVVFLDHGDGIVTVYAHNSSIAVSVGQEVKRGDIIAYSGSTGASTAPHVHFEVQVNGTPQNPLNYL